MDFIET